MKFGKFILAGLSASVIGYLVNSIFGYYFQSLYDPSTGLWRAMTPSVMQNSLISGVIFSFLMVIAYAILNTGLGKKSEVVKKGLKFGFITWILKDIPGSIISYVFMPISLTLVGVWLVSGLIISFLSGLIIAYIYK
jgi:hypothetical protein